MINLSLNILDVVQNSIRAGASTISIVIREMKEPDLYDIEITDNGSGIPADLLPKVTDPFVTTRTTRKVGMGLPLLRQHAIMAGGDLEIESHEGSGTRVKAVFSLSHIDRQPLGDMPGVMMILIAANPETDFIYTHMTDNGEYTFSTRETREYLGTDSLNGKGLLSEIKEMILQNLIDIGAEGIE
ncbi:MAG: ATP-binding protein [Bacteroidales bacterium]|jgi:hypothetical protein|nr:ATP-binding protein [Bacteroidales bacterium]